MNQCTTVIEAVPLKQPPWVFSDSSGTTLIRLLGKVDSVTPGGVLAEQRALGWIQNVLGGLWHLDWERAA